MEIGLIWLKKPPLNSPWQKHKIIKILQLSSARNTTVVYLLVSGGQLPSAVMRNSEMEVSE
jgi:flagellar motor protein MotB